MLLRRIKKSIVFCTNLAGFLSLLLMLFIVEQLNAKQYSDFYSDGFLKQIQNPAPDDTITKLDTVKEDTFIVVEKPPRFPGGEDARIRFLAENIRYPQEARQKFIYGTVYISFVVSKTGDITDVKILRGIHPSIDEESVRVIKLMPKWEPGTQYGKPVNVQYNMPIKFSLPSVERQDEEERKKIAISNYTEITDSNNASKENFSGDVLAVVEEMPQFPGGENERIEFLRKNIRYPRDAMENNIQGIVYLTFVITREGNIEDIKCLRAPSKLLADEAARVIKLMPKWTPGKQNGKSVNVQYNMPIKFTLTIDE